MRFRCPECRKTISVSDPTTEKARCGYCDEIVNVPEPPEPLNVNHLPLPVKSTTALTFRIIIWSLFMAYASLAFSFYRSNLNRAASAIQECSVAAMFLAELVFGYVVLRAIDAITRR